MNGLDRDLISQLVHLSMIQFFTVVNEFPKRDINGRGIMPRGFLLNHCDERSYDERPIAVIYASIQDTHHTLSSLTSCNSYSL